MQNIEYVYGKDDKDNILLIGAMITEDVDGVVSKYRLYVGISYMIDDILNDLNLAKSMGINNIAHFIRIARASNAKRLVYFPKTGNYDFLGEKDYAIPWTNQENVPEQLNEALTSLNIISSEKVRSYDELYDQDDSMVELRNLSLSRIRTESNR